MAKSYRAPDMPAYKIPANAVIEAPPDQSTGIEAGKKQGPVAQESHADPYIPHRGGGVGVLHGVDGPTGDGIYEDQFTKAHRAATVPVVQPDEVEELTPFPVHVVSERPSPRELRRIRTFKITVGDSAMLILGRDLNRTRVLIRLPSISVSDLWLGSGPEITSESGAWPLNLGSGSDADSNKPGYLELNTNDALYGVASPSTTVTAYVLVEYVETLDS